MTDEQIQRWAAAYIEFELAQLKDQQQRSKLDLSGDLRAARQRQTPGSIQRKMFEHPLWWAIDDFMIDHKPAEDCWRAILEILKRAPPGEVLAVLAAGPLEDLINYHGPEFIDRIEVQARSDRAFRELLGGVWMSSTAEVWARLEKARKDPNET